MKRAIWPSRKKGNLLGERDIYEFLPAAIEIERTSASPVGRAILWAIVILFVIAVLWAVFGRIDIVASAQGKVIPSERVKTIQPLEAAIIAAIHIEDGQAVKAGDPLITLDTTITEADVRRLTEEWRDTALKRHRLEALDRWFRQGRREVPAIAAAEPALAARLPRHEALLEQEVAEINAKVANLDREAARLRAGQQSTRAEIEKNRRLLDVLNERVGAYEIMQRKKLGSRMQYLEIRQEQIEVDQEIVVQQARLEELGAALDANRAQRQALLHEYHKTVLEELEQARTRESSLREEKIKAETRNRQYHLIAPLDGTVEQLAVHTIGGVVTPAEELMIIVPAQSDMEVEALVLNKDIGFVREGQPAEIKVNTFNFTKYGMINAELVDLSGDAIQDENLGLVYKARLKLETDGLTVGGNYVRLSPGMSVMAEIKTGDRRIIEFFLSPLLRYKEESLGER